MSFFINFCELEHTIFLFKITFSYCIEIIFVGARNNVMIVRKTNLETFWSPKIFLLYFSLNSGLALNLVCSYVNL